MLQYFRYFKLSVLSIDGYENCQQNPITPSIFKPYQFIKTRSSYCCWQSASNSKLYCSSFPNRSLHIKSHWQLWWAFCSTAGDSSESSLRCEAKTLPEVKETDAVKTIGSYCLATALATYQHSWSCSSGCHTLLTEAGKVL